MRFIRCLTVAVGLAAIVAGGAYEPSTAAFTDSTEVADNAITTGDLAATTIDAGAPQPLPLGLYVSWNPATDVGSSLAPVYTLERSATSDGTDASVVYTGVDTGVFDANSGTPDPVGIPFVSVAAGEVSTAALAEDGTVYTWGRNDTGQLGTDFIRYSPEPVQLERARFEGERITSIASTGRHVAAVSEDGVVYGWGANWWGQLGDGSTNNTSWPVRLGPERFDGLRIVGVATGTEYTIAVAEDGSVWAWGYNRDGELGNGTTSHSLVPVRIAQDRFGGRRIVAVAAGGGHTVAAAEDGSVFTWGWNVSGGLGDGTHTSSSVPVRLASEVFGGRKVIDVVAGDFHTMAVTDDGGVYAWGYNRFGQLGDGSTEDSLVPIEIGREAFGGQGVAAVAAGGVDSAAATEDGSLFVWGYNRFGQLGNGSTSDSSVPSRVAEEQLGGHGVLDLATGGFHTAVVTNQKRVYTWGSNDYGQLGTGNLVPSRNPVNVAIMQEGECPSGATTYGDGSCSLVPGVTYYYRVGYSLGGWDAPSSAWNAITMPGSAEDGSAVVAPGSAAPLR